VTTIIVGKLDAARRQLETAAILYFNELDLVSVHALAAAAYEVVETIAKKRGRSTLIQRSLLDFLTDDLVKEARKAIRSPQNFFKHADKDLDEQLELDPAFTEYIMLDAMVTYAQITGEKPILFNAFSGWFILQKPKGLTRTPKVQETLRLKAQKKFEDMSRQEFIKWYLAQAAMIKHRGNSA
jgi:hypothetical protein